MAKVYLLDLTYINSTAPQLGSPQRNLSDTLRNLKGSSWLSVRVGYFGVCVSSHDLEWSCSPDSTNLLRDSEADTDPLNLIGAATKLKDDVLFSGLLFMAIVFLFFSFILLATFPGWHVETDLQTGSLVDVKPFPSMPVSCLVLALTFSSSTLLLVAGLWQHVGSVGAAALVEAAYLGNVKTVIGVRAIALAWISFVLMTFVTIIMIIMVVSNFILDKLTDPYQAEI
jgi:hypothetical protein